MNSEQKIRNYIREQALKMIKEDVNIPSEEERIAQEKAAKEAAKKEAYKRFVSQTLAKYGVSTPYSLPKDQKKSFFDELANWKELHNENIKSEISEISQKITVDGKTYTANVFYDDDSANAFIEKNPDWGVLKVDGKYTGNPAYDKNYRVYVAKNTDMGIKETSSTGGVSGYQTPYAFTGKPGVSNKQKKIANQLGYELVDKSYALKKEELKEGMDSFYFKDENLTAEQKLGLAMRQVRNNLYEVEKIVQKTIKMKNEESIDSSKVGKRTYSALKRINEKVIRLMVALNDLK